MKKLFYFIALVVSLAASIKADIVTPGVTSIPTGKTLFVDATNGSDATGTRGRLDKPFLTIAVAKTAAISGDTIIIRPGTYTDSNITKSGVSIQCERGGDPYGKPRSRRRVHRGFCSTGNRIRTAGNS